MNFVKYLPRIDDERRTVACPESYRLQMDERKNEYCRFDSKGRECVKKDLRDVLERIINQHKPAHKLYAGTLSWWGSAGELLGKKLKLQTAAQELPLP